MVSKQSFNWRKRLLGKFFQTLQHTSKHDQQVSLMSTIARQRLAAERKTWRKDRPFGFFARPDKKEDDTLDLFKWKVRRTYTDGIGVVWCWKERVVGAGCTWGWVCCFSSKIRKGELDTYD